MDIKPYTRKVQYYETDKMGIVHHSNHIRWFEEARIDLMEQIGYSFDRMEAEGVCSFVLSAAAEYKAPVLFGHTVVITPRITYFAGARMTVSYTVEDPAGPTLHAVGETKVCFANLAGRPVALKKANPELFMLFEEVAAAQA